MLILLMGSRYGAIQSSGLSATHEEYREAKERCPVLVMVQNVGGREPEQEAFLDEVQDWAQGYYTTPFASPDQLRDAVTGALHNLELTRATGPVDPDEMLQRAIALLPQETHRHSGTARLALALAGGPLQTILRPAQLEADALREHLHQMALFGESAVLTTQEGTQVRVDDDALLFEQSGRSFAVSETGAIRFQREIPSPDVGFQAIIDEDMREIIGGFLRFTNAVLTHIDPTSRFSHVALAAKILDAGHLAWRTRAEHIRSPNNMAMNHPYDGEQEAAHLSPPHRTRSALRLNVSELVDDLAVKLRRQIQNPRRQSW